MECSEFLKRFSEFYDEQMESISCQEMEFHLKGCAGCQRYLRVMGRGVELLRKFQLESAVRPSEHRVHERLHRLADGQRLSPGASVSSGMVSAVALGMAILLLGVTWSPKLIRHAPVAERASPPPAVPSSSARQPSIRLESLLPASQGASPRANPQTSRAGFDFLMTLKGEVTPAYLRTGPLIRTGLE